jgi:hypothetical protein
VAPGIPHDLIPAGVEAEWVSWTGELKEAALWSGALATPGVSRRATLLEPESRGGGRARDSMDVAPPRGATSIYLRETTHPQPDPAGPARTRRWTLVPAGAEPHTGPPGRWLHEPDPAVIRAGLVAEAADLVAGRLLDPTIAYVTTDADLESPYTRRWEVLETLPFSLKRLRALLRERGVGRLDVKKRGSALDPDQLRRDLRLRGDGHAVVVLTRIAGVPSVLVCAPPVS